MKVLSSSVGGSHKDKSSLKAFKGSLKSALCVCVSSSSSKHTQRTRSPFDDNDDEEDTWLLGTLPGSINTLPEDVLLAILACFPDKQKAVPLRAVCRAWRDLFNSTVNTITIHSSQGSLPKYPCKFPNLRHLCISQTNSTAAKAAVQLLGVPNYNELTMLEITSVWMQEPPSDLHRLTNLKTLSITSCRMKELASAHLHMLPCLEVLDLSSNSLAELPSAIGSLGRSLRKLNVSDNALTYLPESLGGLTNLQSLRAANNTLVELPDSLADLETLTTLDLSLNRLKAVPKNLGELCNLRQLGLFAAFSHSLRTEGSSTVKVLAGMTMSNARLHLHAEEVVLSLVRMRRKQLQMAAAVEAARNADPDQPPPPVEQDQEQAQDQAGQAQRAAPAANADPWDPQLWQPDF